MNIREAIDHILTGIPLHELKKAHEALSARYKNTREFRERPAVQGKWERLVYLLSRMPATYAAVLRVCDELKRRLPAFQPVSLLDLGAGPGTALWAVSQSFDSLLNSTLVEGDLETLLLGKQLAAKGASSSLSRAHWKHERLQKREDPASYDLVTLSYVWGEIPADEQLPILQSAWENTKEILIMIEPGTPKGYQGILKGRQHLLEKGGALIAPCPHGEPCPMEGSNQWCHFSERLERTKLQRAAKEASLSYEDEKFSYVIFSKHPHTRPSARIIGHPTKRSGHVVLPLCTTTEGLQQCTFSRKQGDLYHQAKKAEWGDAWTAYTETS